MYLSSVFMFLWCTHLQLFRCPPELCVGPCVVSVYLWQSRRDINPLKILKKPCVSQMRWRTAEGQTDRWRMLEEEWVKSCFITVSRTLQARINICVFIDRVHTCLCLTHGGLLSLCCTSLRFSYSLSLSWSTKINKPK